MKSKLNRRQFGQSLISGAALAFAAGGASGLAQQSHSAEESQWQSVGPAIWRATAGTPEAITPVRSRLVPSAAEALRKLPQVDKPVLDPPLPHFGPRGTRLSLPLDGQEEIYGFGLQFFCLNHRGKKRAIRVNADPRCDTGDSHAPVPFYVSSRGYGILVDTARYATFYCGEARPRPAASPEDEGQSIAPRYSKALQDGDESRIIIEIPNAQGIDVYLFAGPTMLDVMRRYNLFSGGGVMPPEWGLGCWYRAASSATDRDIIALAAEFRDRKIPCDVIGLEAGWQSHAYSCTFCWNGSRFPNPQGVIRDLKARDFYVNVWEHAFVHPSSPLFGPMLQLSADTAVWGGLVPDFQSAEARKTFGDYHGKNLIDIGISGFKLDECDNSDFTGGWSFAELSQFPSGADGEQMHSLFGLRYQRAIWEQFLERRTETYSLARSSGALAAPYPFVLYSDLYDHRQFVRALINSGFSGLLWCPEVRDAQSEEDLIRRLQTVVFSPLAMINGWYIPNPPWKQLDRKKNNANELSPDFEKLEARCREILQWRMMFIPYLRAAFARYAADGTPPFRALALDWPDIPEFARVDDAWMMGDRILVAPLIAGESEGRTLTLPPSDWHDFWTGELHSGGATLSFAAATRNIPVYVKSDAVLPLAQVTGSTADPACHTLEVRVFGTGNIPFHLQTPAGTMEIAWNNSLATGSIHMSGGEKYTVLKWTRSDRNLSRT